MIANGHYNPLSTGVAQTDFSALPDRASIGPREGKLPLRRRHYNQIEPRAAFVVAMAATSLYKQQQDAQRVFSSQLSWYRNLQQLAGIHTLKS